MCMEWKGNVVIDDYIDVVKSPRKSWEFRKEQFEAGKEEGLAEWQCNPYYCAGRVLVPALLDAIACHSFLGKVYKASQQQHICEMLMVFLLLPVSICW